MDAQTRQAIRYYHQKAGGGGEGGRRWSRGTVLHRKGKREGGGFKERPQEQLGHSDHRFRSPVSRQSMNRGRQKRETLGKEGEEGSRSLSFGFFFEDFP